MNWQWLVDQGLITGSAAYYSTGQATSGEYAHAVSKAYENASPAQRKQLVDMLWSTGRFQGDKTYWYADRTSEIGDLTAAAEAMGSGQPGAPGADYTDDEATRFSGLPGKPEIWRDSETGEIWAVYMVPGKDIPIMFVVPNESVLKTYFGDKPISYDKTLTTAQIRARGAVPFGDVADLKAQDGDPWAGFVQKMNRAADVMPWLADPEVFGIIAGAYLEGRPVEDWELATTQWYQTRTESEREWMTKVAQDPTSALQIAGDNLSTIYDYFAAYGIASPDQGTVAYIANMYTTGIWTLQYARDQISAITGGGDNVTLDPGLASHMASNTVDSTSMEGELGEDVVRRMFAEWLGPLYTPSDAEINRWAGTLRDNREGGVAQLTEKLRAQRLALFPEYDDATLTWQDISQPWKGMAYNTWGVEVQDDDVEFQEIVRANNAVTAKQQLRSIGIGRGYERTMSEARQALESGMQSGARGAI